MAMVTWLGEDELHGENAAGPSFTHALGGIKFPKGEPVEVRSHALVQKAIGNQFFDVDNAEDVDDAPDAQGKPKRGRPSNAEREAKAKQDAPFLTSPSESTAE